jgi:actin-related protein
MDVYHADVPAGVTKSFRAAAELDIADDAKRSLCEVHETGYLEGVSAAPEARVYELPDGQAVRLSALRHLVPELLFNADVADLLYAVDPADPFRPALSPRVAFRQLLSQRSTPAWLLHHHGAVLMRATAEAGGGAAAAAPIPLPKAVHGALLACAPEVRRDLCANVLLTGGGANLRDLHKRMHWELSAVVPAAFKPRIVAPSPVEREFATWIGGSVLGASRAAPRAAALGARAGGLDSLRPHPRRLFLPPPLAAFSPRAASLGTFQQMWVSKAEYDEEGVRVLEQRCN